MKGDDYSWVSSALYIGWLVGAYPWQIMLQRYPIGKLIGVMLFVWGAVCMLQVSEATSQIQFVHMQNTDFDANVGGSLQLRGLFRNPLLPRAT